MVAYLCIADIHNLHNKIPSNMEKGIKELIEISRKFGKDKNYTIAGGGNTSYKTSNEMWVKASGYGLATISEEGFVKMDREKLKVISSGSYSKDPFTREREVKEDLEKACIDKGKRPSVETSLHDAIDFAFVVHMHPFLINAVLCSNNAEETVNKLWGDNVLYVPYTDPGYVLYKEVEAEIARFKSRKGEAPKIILMQNHGIFVGADTIDEITELYRNVMDDILQAVPEGERSLIFSGQSFNPYDDLQMPDDFLQSQGLTFVGRSNDLINSFALNNTEFEKVMAPFTPDVIVYCKSKYLFVEKDIRQDALKIENSINDFKTQNGFFPKVIIIEGKGLLALGESQKQLGNVLDVFEDQMKIAWFARFFGGPHHMEPHQIKFIDTWEVENYRRKVSGQ
jgi:rhamnose utilization protein RhaD (predicted bifunctional aldolase and dehydrogenase)